MRSRKPAKSRSVRLPGPAASYSELDRFFNRHEGPKLIEQGIMELDPDRADLHRMLREYWKQPNTGQLNIRILARPSD